MSCAWLDTDCDFQATVMLLADELVAEIGEVRADLGTRIVPKARAQATWRYFHTASASNCNIASNLDCQDHTLGRVRVADTSCCPFHGDMVVLQAASSSVKVQGCRSLQLAAVRLWARAAPHSDPCSLYPARH